MDEADWRANRLEEHGVSTVLYFAAERKSGEGSFDESTEEIRRCLIFAASRPYIPFIAFKPTGIGSANVLQKVSAGIALDNNEQTAYDAIIARFNRICQAAAEHEVPLLIDAEECSLQNAIDRIAEQMMEQYNKKSTVVYITLQMYRSGRLDYLKQLHEKAKSKGFKLGIKFVRGAYLENERTSELNGGKNSLINATKEETDQMYDEAIQYSVENINDISIFAGTHNQDSVQFLTELVYKYGIAENDPRIWFSQLYGMGDNLSFNLANEHFNVAKYLPYGKLRDVVPYLIRRLDENLAVKDQVPRELSLIKQEIRRRKEYRKW